MAKMLAMPTEMSAMEDGYVLDRPGKASPQIWATDQFDRPDWQLGHVISRRLLGAAERAMTLNHLASLYPSDV